jgi:hypothetical protein
MARQRTGTASKSVVKAAEPAETWTAQAERILEQKHDVKPQAVRYREWRDVHSPSDAGGGSRPGGDDRLQHSAHRRSPRARRQATVTFRNVAEIDELRPAEEPLANATWDL